ncbi:MAG TPA: hypothetical protein VHG90_02855, partial [Acidimicrobiales bacterium]|nr:hypothetical protein [Acidimicrobiales bacterium]
MRSLFPKKVSVQDIEREVTEELETMVRSGKNPPPESWTLLGGLYGKEPGADEPAPAPPAESAVEEEPAEPPAEAHAVDEAEAPARPARAKAG